MNDPVAPKRRSWLVALPLIFFAALAAIFLARLHSGEKVLPAGGGRVTELVARPLLNIHWPSLAGFVQPLAGEYAGRRSLLDRLPCVSGYGVEIAMLIDAVEAVLPSMRERGGEP